MNSKPVVGAMPVGTPGYMPGDDYVQMSCSYCQRPCWVGPMSAKMLSDGNAEGILCPFCALKHPEYDLENMQAVNPNAKSRVDFQMLDNAIAKGEWP